MSMYAPDSAMYYCDGSQTMDFASPRYPVDLARKKRRRKKKKSRPIALSHEATAASTQVESVDPSQGKVVALSMEEAWDCAPSVSWVIMYFVLIGMVAVSMRMDPTPLFGTTASK